VALPGEDPDPFAPILGRSTVRVITNGLADDTREADERAAARRLAELRGRVKAARKALAAVPGATAAMKGDWRKEAVFLARFGITQAQSCEGVPGDVIEIPCDDAFELSGTSSDPSDETPARALAALPSSGAAP
jgi:hypothetical protein